MRSIFIACSGDSCSPLVWLLVRQVQRNSLGQMCLGYAALLFAMLYLSRFLNENYLGYLLALLALGCFMGDLEDEPLAGARRGEVRTA